MKWKVPDLLFRWRVVLWRAAIISGGGKVTKHGILERNVIYLLLNDSAWPFWNTGQGEHWKRGYFGISIPLELKNWPTWEPNDVVCFPKCQLFYNKFVLTSKGACVLLYKCDHLHIIHFTTLQNTLWVWTSMATSSAGTEVWPDVQTRWKELLVSTFMFFFFYLGNNINIWNGIWTT